MQDEKFNIGVLVGNTHTNQPKEILEGIYEAAKNEPVNMIFFLGTQSSFFYRNMLVENEDNYDYQYNTIYDYAKFANPDALIIAYGSLGIFLSESRVEFLERFAGVPCMVLEDEAAGENGASIIADNYAGMKEIMEHLIVTHGYRKIVYLSGPRDNLDAMERRQAYLDVMHRYGLPVTDSCVAYGNYSEYVDAEADALLDANPGTEALVCANDEMAVAAYRVCRRRGLKVGRDIAVTGFDDVEMARFMDPPLTTVSQNGYEMGVRATRKALQLCRGELPPSERLKTEIRLRFSCGCSKNAFGDPLFNHTKAGSSYDLKQKVQQLTKFQRNSWFGPFLTLNLMQAADRPVLFYKKVMQYLKAMNLKSTYLYLFQHSVVHRQEDIWKCPDKMKLAAFFDEDGLQAYEPADRPSIVRRQGFVQLAKPRTGRHYVAFTLFSGELLYGVMFCEIGPEEVATMYLIALQLGNAIRFMEVSTAERMARKQLQQKNEVLSFISEKDELTGLYNRRGLMEHLIVFNQKNLGRTACLIFVDLDHLKEINDCFGHSEGDYAIHTAGSLLRDIFAKEGIVGRIGGDEFVGVVPSRTAQEGKIIRQRIAAACGRHNACSGKPFYVELSIGIKEFVCREGMDFSELLRNADAYMYEAKKIRRSSIRR